MPASYAPSANVAELRESATIAVSARAKALKAAGRPVIDLGAGEPDFPTPPFIREAAKRALDAGATRYTEIEGIKPLRDAIVAQSLVHLDGRMGLTAADVVVSTGTKQALFNACFVLFSQGDEVLVPSPGWTSYYEMVTLARATAVPVFGSRANDLKVTPADLLAAATPRTRGVFLCSPSNPTGAIYTREEMRAILDCANENGWWVISDEIYRRVSYGSEPAASLLDVMREGDRGIVVDGVGKAYAMTGWRIGWSIAPAAVSAAMKALQSHTTSNATTVSQHAALAALTDSAQAEAALAEMVGAFRERRDAVMEILDAAALDYIYPAGAFYLFVHAGNVTPANPDPGSALARRLLEESDLALVPGIAFRTPEWIRLSYAAPTENVLEGARRLVAMLSR